MKKTHERVQILFECLEAGMPVNLACDFAQIGRTTYYDWYNSDNDFRTQVAYYRAKAIRDLVQLVIQQNPWKILKNIGKDEYKENPY